MKKVRILAAAALSLFVVMGTLSGCSTKKDDPVKTSGEKATWETAPKVVVAIESDMDAAFGKTGEDPKDNPYLRYVFEKSGIRIEPLLYPKADFNNKLSVELSAGTEIDLISYWDIQDDWLNSGMVVKLNDLLVKHKALIPNVNKNITDEGWKGVTKRGDIWAFPGRTDLGKPGLRYLHVRKDWMDKLGLQMPKTTDEVGELMKAFAEKDPDGNGKKDTFGMGIAGSGDATIWFHMFGINNYYEEVQGDKLIPQVMTDRARYAYKTIGSWFKNGWCDLEGLTNNKALETKFTNNKIGAYYGFGTDGNFQRYMKVLHDNGFKEAKWVTVPNMITCSFDNKNYGGRLGNFHATATLVTSRAKNIESAMKLMNWMFSEEGTEFQEFGLPGRDHNVVDGKKKKDIAYRAEKGYLKLITYGKSYNHVYADAYVESLGGGEFLKQYVDLNVKKGNELNTVFWKDIKYQYPELGKEYPDWRKGIDEYLGKFLYGQLDPVDDNNWKKFIETSNKYGAQAYMDAAYKKYKADGGK